MKISITNVGFDFHESQHNLIGANALDAIIGKHDLQFPMIAPHQSELKKSKLAKIQLRSPLLQYVHVPKRQSSITDTATKQDITQDYGDLLHDNPEVIGDFFYQYYPSYPPNNKEREAILDVQRNAGAMILSDYESKPEQSVEKFEQDILDLRNNNRKFIPSPTIDIGITTIGLFAKKVDKLIEHKFQRFNVVYRTVIANQVNWIDLSHRLFTKNIWCNIVGIQQRYLSKINPVSLTSTSFLYGAHSASLGYPIIRNKNQKIQKLKHNFNNLTYTFDEVDNISDSESRTISINDQINELAIARKHIINKTFFSQYVKSKSGLLETLNSIP